MKVMEYHSFSSPSGCSGEIDLVFAIDASGSIRVERFPYVLDFAISIAEELEIRNGKMGGIPLIVIYNNSKNQQFFPILEKISIKKPLRSIIS